ncbi:HNH endonuclease [Endozoicomonas sp. 2B-B]
MTFEDYYQKLPIKKKLSNVKQIILKRVWGKNSAPFPKPWVSSAELLELTRQKYFDRRTRELRDALGCDLESAYQEEFEGHAWRLRSDILTAPQVREYLTKAQKDLLFFEAENTCATCGTQTEAGVRGLQADHKIPLSRGGTNDLENWQPICNNCNVEKRRACEGCNLNCQTCSWAFPDKHGVPSMLYLSEPVLKVIESISKTESISREEAIRKAVEAYREDILTRKHA